MATLADVNRARALRTALLAVAAVVVLALLVSTVAVVALIRRPLPEYSATVELPGLDAEVTVFRDERGVPQIWADTPRDLFAAQGYVHAQDRFFEMDYRRHVTAGRLSELVGADPDVLAADRMVRTLGWRRVAQQELPLLEADTRSYLQAYADGVNAYLRGRSPSDMSVAYTVLDLNVDLGRIEPWKPVDSLAWLKSMAWDLRSNYEDEMGRALAFGSVGDRARVEELWPPYPYDVNAPILPPETRTSGAPVAPAARLDLDVLRDARGALEAAAGALDAVPRLLGGAEGAGSNSWVVSGEHTESGRPLLANDPHLSPGMPGVWYQVGLHCTDVGESCPFDVSGFGFSGIPGVVVGHNASIAWGMTSMRSDVTDFFLERVAGNDTYLVDGRQVPLDMRTESIKVAGGEDVEITIRSTAHGPILSDAMPTVGRIGSTTPVPRGSPAQGTGYEVALRWTGLDPGRSADAIFAINVATDWEEFRSAAALLDVPAQNLLYADTRGRIGYQASGRIPVRPAGTGAGQQDGTWPRLGWSSAWDWTGYIPFDDLPSALNPPGGFLVSANQPVTGPDYLHQITQDWDYGYRAQRIRDLVSSAVAGDRRLTAADMASLQLDTRNGFAPVLVPFLVAAPMQVGNSLTVEQRNFTLEAVDLLRTWDFTQTEESAAAAYYNAVWRELLELTFADDLPDAALPRGGSRWFEVIRTLLQNRDSPWWDDRTTPTVVENRDQIISQALVDARLDLTARLGKDPSRWQWGYLHTLQLRQSPLGDEGMPRIVTDLFNPDLVQLGGDTSVVNATSWDARNDGFAVTSLPSMRMVVDLGDLDASTWVDLTGVSGHPWSAEYGNQLGPWAAGEQFPWPFTRAAVEEAAEDTLVLRPVPDG